MITNKGENILMFKLTNRCNYNCVFCCDKNEKEECTELSLEQFKVIINGHSNNLKTINLIGGETTLYKNLNDLMDFLSEKNVERVVMETNGTGLQNIERVNGLIEKGIKLFIVGFHDCDEERYELLTKNKKSLFILEKAIRNIIASGGNVVTNTLITINNYEYIEDIIDYGFSLGVRSFMISNFIPPIYLNDVYYNHSISIKEIISDLEIVIKNYEKKGAMFKLQYFPHCGVSVFLRDKIISEITEIHYIDNNGLAYKTNSNWTSKFSVKTDKCLRCLCNSSCNGVFKQYIEKYGWDEFNEIKE